MNEIRFAIRFLEMVKRRQEVRGTYHDAIVIDDFAHHPRAVQLTVDTVRARYPGKKTVVVIEPNSATARSAIFQNEFAESLLGAAHVILARPARPTSVPGVGDLDCAKIADFLKQRGREAEVVSTLTDLRPAIDRAISHDALLLILSNGTCLGLWESDFVEELKRPI